jgi:hypothetical protein
MTSQGKMGSPSQIGKPGGISMASIPHVRR